MRGSRARFLSLFVVTAVGCAGSAPGPNTTTSSGADAGASAAIPQPIPTPPADTGADAGSAPPPPPNAWTFSTKVITTEHRSVPGAMFGGWGPHLGHFARTQDALYWVDDACAPGTCDVNVDARIDYWKIADGTIERVFSAALPGGVQQNTGTVASADTLWTYGIGVAGKYLVECALLPAAPHASPACNALAVDIGDAANYVGAAIHPGGTRLVWLTNVVDDGGGSFRFYANYGQGWNGPRLGGIGGYNDASYIDVAFVDRKAPGKLTMLAELVSGVAPSWTFRAGTGEGDLAKADAVTWSLAASVPSMPSISPADIFVDPASGDTHVLAYTDKDSITYVHRSPAGSWDAPVTVIERSFRARFVLSGSRLFVANDVAGKGLAVRELSRGPGALDWAAATPVMVPLPAGYESLYAIYPEAEVYQTEPVRGVNLAIVGSVRDNEVLGVFATPP
jgi:hypothetical protein